MLLHLLEITVAIIATLCAGCHFFSIYRATKHFTKGSKWLFLALICSLFTLLIIVLEYASVKSGTPVVYQKLGTHILLVSSLSIFFSALIVRQLHHDINLQAQVSVTQIELQKSKLQTILDNLTDGVIVIDADRKILVCNPTALKLLHKRSFKVGDDVTTIFKPHNDSGKLINIEPVNTALKMGTVQQFDATYFFKIKGKILPIAGAVAPINDQNKTTGAIIIFRDNTKEKQINDEKTEFVSVVSHQLRTPLTGIKWFLQLVKQSSYAKLTPQELEHIEHALESTERIIHLVNDLLNVSRIDNRDKFSVTIQEIDLADVVNKSLEDNVTMIANYNAKVANTVKTGTMVMADPEKIYEAINNLITNAIKYSHGKVKLSSKKLKDKVVLSIKDNGIGIPAEAQKQLFQKFYRAENAKTLKIEGTGLGLYIVKAIVEANNGQIDFTSTEGRGSVFNINLKLANAKKLR